MRLLKRSPTPIQQADLLEKEGRVLDAIDLLTEANRAKPSPDIERRLVQTRLRAFSALDPKSGPMPDPVMPAVNSSLDNGGLPEVAAGSLDPATLRGAVLGYGSLIVRGLIEPVRAARLAEGIDKAFDGRDAGISPPWYEPLEPGPEFAETITWGRHFVTKGSGLWIADSPRLLFELTDALEGARWVITRYLGERPAISVSKGTLRRAQPSVATEWWHQDGAFLGEEIRSLNIWLALTECGQDAPGIDVVARRLDGIVESGTEGADFDWSVGRPVVDRVSEGRIARPLFRPGDALLFDHLCLHKTATEGTMTRTRYATETWFFAPSAYPDPQKQVPLVF